MKTAAFLTTVRVMRLALPFGVALALGAAMLVYVRGTGIYDAPKFGGIEPTLTQNAALEIVATGRTTMTYHATGYSYLVALIYLVLPRVPLSVLWVQVGMLPLVVWCTGCIASFLGGSACRRWGIWAAALYYPFGYYAATFTSVYPALVFGNLAIVASIPLLRARRSLGFSILTGLGLGIVACLRPNFAFFGAVLAAALWRSTGSFWEALIRSLPIAATSSALLAIMTFFNPPERGEIIRGGAATGRLLLEGTYEYENRWWDWDFMENDDDPAFLTYNARLKQIEAETGKSISDSAIQPAIRRAAWRRILDNPLATLKKILISTVRVWILIPTHLESMPAKVACAAQEFLLLGLALAGLFMLAPGAGRRVLAIGVLAVPTITHWLIHVEPRYSLPSRGVELALAVVAVLAIAQRVGVVKSSPAELGTLAT